MLELNEALSRILASLKPLECETIGLAEAVGRVLAEPVIAPVDLPSFDNSAMDGFAVQAADVAAVRREAPVPLKLCGQVAAGETWTREVPAGSCVRIFTGSALPPGADAVVMQEDARLAAEFPGVVLILDRVTRGENVRFRGEDVKAGSVILPLGERVTAASASLLAASGIQTLKASRQPVVGILTTGSELVEAGQQLAVGKVYESNRIGLTALLRAAGAKPQVADMVPDDLSATTQAIERAFAQCDVVVTTGGASVGKLDFVKQAFQKLGGALDFWQVAIRPGKPFVFGRWRDKALFGLPGNPVSALVTFLLLVRPAMLHLQRATQLHLRAHPATLAESLANTSERRHFMRVTVDEQGLVRSSGRQGSHIVSSLARANGLVDVPPRTTFAAGEVIRVLRWGE